MDDWNDHWMTEEERDEAVRKILHDRMMAENDWRDEGTEANRRVERLLMLASLMNAASIPLMAGAIAATFIAVVSHTTDHSDNWLFCIAAGSLGAAWNMNMAAGAFLKKLRAITEAG